MSSCTLGCLLRELKVLREKSKLCDSLLEERKMLYEMLQNEDLKMDELAQTLKDQAEEIKKLKDENLELIRVNSLSEAMMRANYERMVNYQSLYPYLF